MPLTPFDQGGININPLEKPAFEQPALKKPTLWEGTKAAFAQENMLAAGAQLLTRRMFPADPEFDVGEHLRKNYPGLIESGRAIPFARARSLNEFEDIRLRIDRENQNNKIIKDLGWKGMVLAMGAGMLDPTLFIPFVTEAKGVKAVAEGAALLGFTAAMQEGVLNAAQETRTGKQSMLNIGASIILGGILGGAAGHVRARGERYQELLRRVEDDLTSDAPKTVEGERPKFNEPNSIGAERTHVSIPTGTKGILGKETGAGSKFGIGSLSLERMGPLTRSLNSTMSTVRWAAAQLDNPGLLLKGLEADTVAAQGGTLWSRRLYWNGKLAKGLVQLDELYSKYVFGQPLQGPFKNVRTVVGGLRKEGKLNQTEFFNEVTRALRQGEDYTGIPEAKEAASMLTKEIYTPMFEEAKNIGLIPSNVKLVGDTGFANRMWDVHYVKEHRNELVDIFAKHVAQKRAETVSGQAEKVLEKVNRAETALADFGRGADETAQLKGDFEAQIAELTSPENEVQQILDQMDNLRESAKIADKYGEPQLAQDMRDQLKELHEANRAKVKEHSRTLATARRRLRQLDKTYEKLIDRQRDGIIRLARVEDQQIDSLRRMALRVSKIEKKVAKLTPEQLAKESELLAAKAMTVLEKLEKQNKTIAFLVARNEGELAQFLELTSAYLPQYGRLRKAIEKLEESRSFELEGAQITNDLLALEEELFVAVNKLNSNRTLRMQKMEQRLKDVDPQAVLNRLETNLKEAKGGVNDFVEKWRERGLDIESLDAEGVKATDPGARDIAARMVDRIMGSPAGRNLSFDLLTERGSELERVIDISSEEVKDFLENNVEKLIRTYVRTLAPDIEIYRRFGSVNGQTVLDQMKMEYDDLVEATTSATKRDAVLERLTKELKAAKGKGDLVEAGRLKGTIDTIKANPTTGDVRRAYEEGARDFAAMIGRMRHTWGLPADPSGWAARGARIAMNLNTLRFMGMVLISSIPDVARLVMQFGPVRVYKSGLQPLITNFKTLKLSAQEAKLAGVANDIILHSRMFELAEMTDEFAARTRFEQGLEFMTSKIGIAGGFDYWNSAMKQLAGVLHNAEALDAMATIMDAGHRGAKSPKEAAEYLARLNIDSGSVQDIWKLVKEAGGGEKVDGVWLPNSDDWVDVAEKAGLTEGRALEMQRIYRAALARVVDNTIVTPGLERPLWMDGSLTGKIIGQFRSFAVTSTYTTTMAGMQAPNARFATGTAVSLGLGALSYYLWGLASGNDTTKDGWDKWADEMVDRSGLIGVFGEARNIGSTIPFLNDYVMFSGEQTTRRGGTGFAGALLGPSIDLANSVGGLLSGLDDPTQGTARYAQKILPYQNLWWARQLVFDRLVEVLNLPQERTK